MADTKGHEIIYHFVEGIRSLEDNEDYLALPCYFLLKLKDFYAEYSKFPHAADNLNQILVHQIFMKEEKTSIFYKKLTKIEEYCNKNKITL
jgi:hypothetical protein